MKKPLFFLLLLNVHHVNAQQKIFSENFESKTLSENWQPVSGNWSIADVQEKRIAPAENGFQYVLSSKNAGFIRLIVVIPDSIQTKKIKLSFYYYSKTPTAGVEVEFHKKDWKDGLKGKIWKTGLPVKGRWTLVQKTLSLPSEANVIWLSFETKSSQPVYFDNIIIRSAL